MSSTGTAGLAAAGEVKESGGRQAAFAVAATGIYYVPGTRDTDAPLRVMDPDTGVDRLIGTLEKYAID